MTLEEIFTRLERKYPYTFVYSFRSLKEDRFNTLFFHDYHSRMNTLNLTDNQNYAVPYPNYANPYPLSHTFRGK